MLERALVFCSKWFYDYRRMILGIGTDLVDIRRIERLVERFGDRALNFIYSDGEQKDMQQYSTSKLQACFLAKRFAAKEAFAKACGLGFRQEITFKDINITRNAQGMPFIQLSQRVEEVLQKKFHQAQIKIDLSLADEYPMAQAFVIISSWEN